GVFVGLGSLVEVWALRALTAVAAPLRPGRAERVATGAVGREEDGPVVVGVVFGDRDRLLAEPAGGEPEGGGNHHRDEQYWTHAARIILSGDDPDLLTMPPPDPASFRAAMANLPTGVTIVTAGGRDGPAGADANAAHALSIAPTL